MRTHNTDYATIAIAILGHNYIVGLWKMIKPPDLRHVFGCGFFDCDTRRIIELCNRSSTLNTAKTASEADGLIAYKLFTSAKK